MPTFVEEIIENHFWNDDDFKIPDFPSGSEEEILIQRSGSAQHCRIPDAFVFDNIETM